MPIRLRPPVLTCFTDLESRNLKDLVLIPSGLARISLPEIDYAGILIFVDSRHCPR